MTTLVAPRVHDLGGFQVRRAVPSLEARSVGPFVFVDHMGPAVFEPGRGIDVRPHPHIGLATVTFLWAGTMSHRDTLGNVQDITPGAVNWMTAGRGIAHSERSPVSVRSGSHEAHGMQTWVALPKSHEETEPGFFHHEASALPQIERNGVVLRVIAGRAFGEESPVSVFTDTFNVAVDMVAESEFEVDAKPVERALYVLEGEVQVDGVDIPSRHLVVLDRGVSHKVRAKSPVKAMFVGGEPLDARRHMWWNFVSSSQERIEQAKEDWKAGRFGQIAGETEFIPLPE
jgi:redox-sensitive bicupin YhaK (pirin superfamily)